MSEAELARDQAIQRVQGGADVVWMQVAEMAVLDASRTVLNFTTDDVWERIPQLAEKYGLPADTVIEPRALGAVMVKMSREQLIEATALYQKSRRRACHARPIRVWTRGTAQP